MAGGGLGNVDPRQQRNPSTASPFGGSMTTARPEPINYEAPQPGRPYMGVGIQPQQPYGMQPMQPYGMPRPIGLQGQPMMPVGYMQPMQQPCPRPHVEGSPYQGPMPDLQYNPGDQGIDSKPEYEKQLAAQQVKDSFCQQNPMARGCEGMGSGTSAQLGSAVGPQIGRELFK
jgi:hypothetical protein